MSVKELSPASLATSHEAGESAHDAVTLTAQENAEFDAIAEKYTQDNFEQETTLRYRAGLKIGRFAAKGVFGALSVYDNFKDKANNFTLKAVSQGSVRAMSAMNRVDEVSERLKSSEDETPAKRRMKKIGRKAVAAAAGVLTLAGLGAAYYATKDTAPAETLASQVDLTNRSSGLPNIHVPGTGFSLPGNVYEGSDVTVGYHASAGPFVEGPRYDTSVAHGVERLFEALDKTGDGQKVVEGYSQGADVIREAASKLSEDEQRQLILNLSGDPSGETGVLTLAHDSWQGQLMGALGFDTSELKSTGAATVNEVRVTNDIMADATFTIADAEKFNAAVDSQDYVTVLRMLAGTVEKAGGYATNHAGMIEVLPEHQVFHDPINPGNATVVTEQRPNGVLHKITPNVTALEQVAASQFGIHLTPEAQEAYKAIINPEVPQDQMIREIGDAAREGIDNTPWIDPNHKPIINNIISGVAEQIATYQPPAPAPAPAPVETFVAPVVEAAPAPAPAPVAPAPAPAPAAPAFVAPPEVQQIVEQAAPVVNQIATDLERLAPQHAAEINQVRNFFQPQQ